LRTFTVKVTLNSQIANIWIKIQAEQMHMDCKVEVLNWVPATPKGSGIDQHRCKARSRNTKQFTETFISIKYFTFFDQTRTEY